MAKKLFASEEEINAFLESAQAQLIEETKSLKKRKFQTDDEREITLKFKLDELTDDRKAYLLFTAKAWAKMYALVHKFSTEVEWHGVVERTDDTSFIVKDVLIFPHEVTGATVVSDQHEYEEWLDSLDDETFNHLRFHGHSHVNMGVTPSGVDMGYRKNVLNNFGTSQNDNDFYIFLITNKRGEISGEIYDLKNNVLYTKSAARTEIEIDVLLDDDDYMCDFLAEADSVVKERKYTPPPATKTPNYSGSYSSPPSYGGSYYGHGVGSYSSPRRDAKTTAHQDSLLDGDDGYDYDDGYFHGIYGGK